ncbi:acylphosphatase, partial [Candidatus Bathyarchaeota archaeon]
MIRAHITVEGRVQGVGFRANTNRMANQLGLKGWVRNLRDGKVEIIAEGEPELVDRLILW